MPVKPLLTEQGESVLPADPLTDVPIIGHRGAAGHAPENTLAGFRVAARLGIAAVEFDVRLSRDGVPVLLHDATLERTTGGTGAVADHDLATLQTLDAGGWFGPAFRGEPIPTLAEAIATLARLGLAANIELKAELGRERATAAAVAAAVARHWPPGRLPPLLSSFDEACLAEAAATAPALPRALLVSAIPADWQVRCRRLGCTAVHAAAATISGEAAAMVLAAGLPVRCYTVNDRDQAARLFALGVSALFSDWPDRLAGLGPAA